MMPACRGMSPEHQPTAQVAKAQATLGVEGRVSATLKQRSGMLRRFLL